MSLPEPMDQFFDNRASGYEAHMLTGMVDVSYYQAVAGSISSTDKPISILDLGAGTGLELEYIFLQAPNAVITCVDLSAKMLELLQLRYTEKKDQIIISQASYLDHPWGGKKFDYIISSMTLHHFTLDIKIYFYRQIKKSLQSGGLYIEGDYVVDQTTEKELLEKYYEIILANPNCADGACHIDIPFSIDTQKQIFSEAGLTDFKLIYHQAHSAVYSLSP